MNERQPLEELAGPISMGLLAEEVVLAVGMAMRDEELGHRERRAIEHAQAFLRGLSSTTNDIIGPAVLRQMDSDQTYMDAFRAIKLHAPDQPFREYLEKVEQVLGKALEGKLETNDQSLCLDAQRLFLRVGEIQLARTSGFFERSKEDPFSWTRINKKQHS